MNLALFDFDGTITRGDTWTPFVRFALPPSRLLLGSVLLSPVLAGYRLGVVPATQGRRMTARVGFAGADAAAVRARGIAYARTVLPDLVRPAAIERIEWHRALGDRIVVVSASLDVYLAPWCETHRVDCICTTLEERGGRLTGGYVEGDCCGEEKARRTRRRLDMSQYPLVYAYGDSLEDRPLLDLAQRKFYRWKEISCWDEVTSYEHSNE